VIFATDIGASIASIGAKIAAAERTALKPFLAIDEMVERVPLRITAIKRVDLAVIRARMTP